MSIVTITTSTGETALAHSLRSAEVRVGNLLLDTDAEWAVIWQNGKPIMGAVAEKPLGWSPIDPTVVLL